MAIHGFLKRIERAEKALKAQGHFSSECICFPENEPIGFSWPLEQQIAFALKCPLHGDRFRPMGLLYVSEWLRDKQQYFLAKRKSAQYRKAWAASFPPDLWPGQEGDDEDGRTVLKLKDGTSLLVYEPRWKPLSKIALPAPPLSGGISIEHKMQG